jgi:hypothetical protein
MMTKINVNVDCPDGIEWEFNQWYIVKYIHSDVPDVAVRVDRSIDAVVSPLIVLTQEGFTVLDYKTFKNDFVIIGKAESIDIK